jgi:hypothetical protein
MSNVLLISVGQSICNPAFSTGPPNLALSFFRPNAMPTTGGNKKVKTPELPTASVTVHRIS